MLEEDHEVKVTRLDDTLYCRTRRVVVLLETCLDNFVDAGAFHKESSACYNCRQGADNRRDFASSAETSDIRIGLKMAFAKDRGDKGSKRKGCDHRTMYLTS